MSQLCIQSVHLPIAGAPVEGVPLEPIVKTELCPLVSGSSSLPDPLALGSQRIAFRWFRLWETAETSNRHSCHFHPDRHASFVCAFWRQEYSSLGYPFSHACHCSIDCFKQNWNRQLQYWEKAQRCSVVATDANEVTVHSSLVQVFPSGGEAVVGNSKLYVPVRHDVGQCLKCCAFVIDAQTGEQVPLSEKYVITEPVRRVPEPHFRRMVSLYPSGSLPSMHGRFTVLTYNILADLYATQQAHPSTDARSLQWEYRRQIILEELAMFDADIVCLQEVQSTSFELDLLPAMKRKGFDAEFKKKTQGDMMVAGGLFAMDGCATFYRRCKFKLVKKYEVEFNKAAQSLLDSSTCVDDRRNHSRLMKPNVALILVLEDIQDKVQVGSPSPSGSKGFFICVANTHIHANQELTDVKLWQVQTLIKGLEKIANSAQIPMVVAGDLNSVPGSAAHTLMMTGGVDATHEDLQHDPMQLFTGTTHKLTHRLKLRSAYAEAMSAVQTDDVLHRLQMQLDDVHHEPRYTNVTSDFKGTLDYILFSSPQLYPTALLELPSLSQLLGCDEAATGLPTNQWPSDHIALMAEFQFSECDSDSM